ncbi:MAG: cysteine desulfurase family protein (TIGR01976 family) [Saprospiraceae bacterium]|jgi:cysteine desulfurase family protein (TIGR01976 family)
MSSTENPVILDVDYVRKQFPALKNKFVFMDNAGGSQTLGTVMNRITDYLTNYDVQLGASYEVSANAGKVLNDAHQNIAEFINAKRPEEVVIGPSTTMLLRILSLTISSKWKKGSEVIVTNSDHEANVSCWTDLKKKGIEIKVWKVNKKTLQFEIGDLTKLMSKKTKLVAMVHVSNILGTINPIKKIAKVVHEAGALFCVDGVAYAPHRQVDVQKSGADFYVFSWYKIYGPHQAVLYGRYDLLKKLDSFNHYFIEKDVVPYKLQPGNFNFELTYSLAGIPEYFIQLHDYHYPEAIKESNKKKVKKSFALIAEHEARLADYLLFYLFSNPDVIIVGHTKSDKKLRVPTISFIHKKLKSTEIVEKVDPFGIGIRFGDFYAVKLIHDLGLEKYDGVVRISLVHYNTMKEVHTLVKVLEGIL